MTAVLATSVDLIALRVLVALVLAAVTTVIAMRLLGIRRGWGRGLLAALAGWLTGGIVALSLVRWDWGTEGLVVTTLAIAVPATMAIAVGLDLVRRPGSLAASEVAGLVTAPRPVQAVRRRLSVIRRYRELLGILQREGFGPGAAPQGDLDGYGGAQAVRIRRVLEEAGGVYIKLGQIAATRIDLVPPAVADELASLQNRVAPESAEAIRQVLEAELRSSVEEVFAEFDWEPLAAASVGQTHVARLRSGEDVVVKVQRPGIEEVMERDLAALALLADLAQRRTVVGRGVRSGEILAEFAQSLRAELDFRREADAMEEMALLLADRTPVRIPKVHRELCGRRVLVQERLHGCALADREGLDQGAVDRRALADQLLRTMLDQVMDVGFFHADPHPGNVLALSEDTLGLIDFGAVGRLDPLQQTAITEMMAGLVTREVGLLRSGIERVADVSEAGSPDDLERALARLLADNVRPTGAVAPTVMQDLVATLTRFGMRLPHDLILLSRAMVTLDGTVRVLAPGVSLMSAFSDLSGTAAVPPRLDPSTMARNELKAALPLLRRLPDRIDRILTLTGRGELRLRTVVDEDSRRILRTLVNRALLAAVGASFLLASVVLLASGDPGPVVNGDVGLFEVFGYGGLFTGTTLLLRVVAGVARDGTT